MRLDVNSVHDVSLLREVIHLQEAELLTLLDQIYALAKVLRPNYDALLSHVLSADVVHASRWSLGRRVR